MICHPEEENSDSDKFLSHKRRIIILFRRLCPGSERRKLLVNVDLGIVTPNPGASIY